MTLGRPALLMLTAAALTGYLVWSGDAALILPMIDQLKSSGAEPEIAAVQQNVPAEPAATPVVNPLSTLTPDDLQEMVLRPLFNPTRAPAPAPPPAEVVSEPAEEAPPPVIEDTTGPQDFTLLGVASRDGIWTAAIRMNKTNEVFHLKQGEAMSEWQFTEANSREIILSNAGKSIELKLFQDTGNRNPAPSPEQVQMQQQLQDQEQQQEQMMQQEGDQVQEPPQ